MRKSSGIPRWWDWTAVAMLFILLQTAATRLVTTAWTPFLFITQTVTPMGFVIGAASGYTIFSHRTTRWLTFLYMLILLPLQWMRVIDQTVSLEEQWMSMTGRLFFSFLDFFARRPVEDPIFFVAIMSIAFWIISTSAGFHLIRNQNFLAAVLPSAIGLLIIQNYDNAVQGRLWYIAFFAFIALFLLGRLNFLRDQKRWRETRVFLSPDNSVDITSAMAVAAGLIILVSWTVPASLSSLDSAVKTWNKVTRPWREFTERMENAVTALESPSGGKLGEFFGSELELGRGFPLSDLVMFQVQAPDLPTDEIPPRYYWRGRTYDYYVDSQWYTTGTTLVDYSPADTLVPPSALEGAKPARFVFNTGEITYSLIYAPAQPIWLSRKGSMLKLPADSGNEIISWYAIPVLLAGETYQVDATLSNPNIQQLRDAGTTYPAWVAEHYLQLPENFSPKIQGLALDIAAEADTPYDKTAAITKFLRDNIQYAEAIPQPPRNQDPLEWILFEHKQAYCVYYATAEVLMLRSLGIPARMAVGFAQGERDGDSYIVRKLDAHAWPEVYFPGIGWVEFEPTGIQPPLSRPLPPRDEENDGSTPAFPNSSGAESDLENLRGLEEGEGGIAPDGQVNLNTVRTSLYLIPLIIALAALTVFLNRRYAVAVRVPILLRTSFERSGAQTPNWIVNWERWVSLSPIEKSFESINLGLRLLKQPAPIHATPIERAKALTKILPHIESRIQTLLDEHQTSLYTSRDADAAQARRAAFHIRIQIIIAIARYFWTGAYSAQA
jgi:transglutaminase-like putative cysteine protease